MEPWHADDGRARARHRFIEKVGLTFESVHLPRMSGRLLGALLLGPAEGLTAAELASALDASKASISSSTRLLVHYGFIERSVGSPDRRDRFVVSEDAWTRVLEERFEFLRSLRDLATDGLEQLDPSGDPRHLREARDMYGFLEREWPALIERWEQSRHAPQHEGGEP